MVITPTSASMAEGLMITIGQITWMTGTGGLATTTSKETQIQSATTLATTPTTSATITITLTMSPTMPTTHPPLSRYNGKQIDNSGEFNLTLVNSISGQTTRVASADYYGSTRPTRVTRHKQLEIGLTIIATLEGQTT